jgi:protein-S-isoprenylcysteine O-methyltransferase Ste14
MLIFKIMFWIVIIAQIVIRAPLQKVWKAKPKTERRFTATEGILLNLLLVNLIVSLIYTFTNWLSSADYSLPVWAGWMGVGLAAAALWVFARSHADLKSNWSPTLEIMEGQHLITSGIYGYIRHPMYASQFLLCFAQILLLQNWIAGPIGLIIFIPFYFFRMIPEEKMMVDKFGDTYRQYMKKTGRVLPKLG